MTTRRPRLATELLEGRDLPATAFGLNAAGSSLFRFDTATPATLSPAIPVSGTVLGDVLVAIDYRPATGQLYAVGANVIANTVQVYTLDPNTGVATAVGAAPVAFPGTNTIVGATHFSMDFNPVADRIRVITDLASDGDNAGNVNNFRLNPTTGALVAVDPDLDFTALPGGSAPEAAIAYTNSGGGSTPAATTLLGITSGGDQLVTHTGAPGFPTLTAVGALGADTGVNAGFDIYGPDNTAVAILNVGGVSGLYTINATTGAATLVGNVGDGTTQFADLAVDPNSGAVVLRAEFPNTRRELLPGTFVRVRLPQAEVDNAIRIPQRAVLGSPQGQMVMTVDAEGKVAPRPIETGAMSGTDFIVNSGLKGGEQVIVNGLQKARPGSLVKPVPWNPAGPIMAAPPAPPAAPASSSGKPADEKK